MKLNNSQKKSIADFFQKFAIAIATATAVRLFFDDNESLKIVYLLAAIVVVIMLAISTILLKNVDIPDQMHTEVKKGIFHIHNAEVKK